jgi:hypothetical protein
VDLVAQHRDQYCCDSQLAQAMAATRLWPVLRRISSVARRNFCDTGGRQSNRITIAFASFSLGEAGQPRVSTVAATVSGDAIAAACARRAAEAAAKATPMPPLSFICHVNLRTGNREHFASGKGVMKISIAMTLLFGAGMIALPAAPANITGAGRADGRMAKR